MTPEQQIAAATDQIEAAYNAIPRQPGGFVSLADLRDKLGNIPRDIADKALLKLARRPDVRLVPISIRKLLTPRDHAAALRIGEDMNNLIAIGVS